MSKWRKMFLISTVAFISACVTINVYFPAAEVDSAAEKVVKDILNSDDDQSWINRDVIQFAHKINPVNWFISEAHAQVDINLSSPAITGLTNNMKARFDKSLKAYMNKKIVGFTNKGFVELVSASSLSLKDRQLAKKVVADENRDRAALYREMAIANDHPEWEDKIRQAFVKQWIDQAKTGWFYQNAQSQWVEK